MGKKVVVVLARVVVYLTIERGMHPSMTVTVTSVAHSFDEQA